MTRLYIVVRNDLKPGLQLAQSVHALAAFEQKFPDKYRAWVTGSNNIVCLQVPDERALEELLLVNEPEAVPFFEPDLGGEMTAIALTDKAMHLSALPLALRAAGAKAA